MKTKIRYSVVGFTLTEIMIVAGIIGILATVAIPNFIRAREVTRKNCCLKNQRTIYEVAVSYELITGGTLEALSSSEVSQKLLDENYIKNRMSFECPTSDTDDYDDYSLIYQAGHIANVNCTIDPTEHNI